MEFPYEQRKQQGHKLKTVKINKYSKLAKIIKPYIMIMPLLYIKNVKGVCPSFVQNRAATQVPGHNIE